MLDQARVHLLRDRLRKPSPWGVSAIVLGVGFGAAIGSGNTLLTAALALGLAAVLAAIAFGLLSPAPAESPRLGWPAEAESIDAAGLEVGDRLRKGLWVGTAATLLIVAADAQGYADVGSPALRYGLLVVPVFALLAAAASSSHRARLDRTTASDRFLTLLVVCGVLGSIYGRLFRGTIDSGTVIFFPMCLGLTHLLVRAPNVTPDAERYQRVLTRAAVLFLVLRILAKSSFWPLGTPTTAAHEELFFVAMGLAAAVFWKQRAIALLIVALAVVMFLQYPAATWLIVAMSAFATGFATSRRGRRAAFVVMVVFAVGILGFALTQVQGGQSGFAKDYFASVGKGNNTDTRSQLWKAAELEIKKSPLVGSLFSGNFTVPNVNGVISTQAETVRIEPHNDYLEITVLGGLLGLLIFGAFIISTNVIVIRRVHCFSDLGSVSQRNLARVLLIGFNAALSGAFFNPELSQAGICASIFLIYSLMMTIRPMGILPAEGSGRLFVGATSEGRR